jgi:hypothetical protein
VGFKIRLEGSGFFIGIVRMAFNNSANIDNLLIRGLNFRYPNNAPVSSFFSLYANGNGQTYWSNAITGDNLSTISTSLGIQTSTFYDFVSTNTAIDNQQSSNISTLYGAQFSSVFRLLSNDASLSNSVNILSNQFIVNSNLTVVQFANYNFTVNSTLNAAVASASTYGPIYSSISTVQGNLQTTASSLSTSISLQNTSTYITLTSNYERYTRNSLISTVLFLQDQILFLNNDVLHLDPFGLYSTSVTNELLSTSTDLIGKISSLSTYTFNTLNTLSTQTNTNFISTSGSLGNRVSSLEGLSTSLTSSISSFVWPYVTASLASTTTTTLTYINQNSNAIAILNTEVSSINRRVSSISTVLGRLYLSTNSSLTSLTSQVSDLWFAYSTLTASSILVNIWSSFYNLEQYTSSIIGIRYSTISQYELNVYRSTVAQNISTSASYFDFYVSTLYNSTLSTLIPSTIAFTSSMVSTLYSTSYAYMFSTINSSIFGVQSTYISTSYGLNDQFLASTQAQVNSSLVGYIGLPAASSFSTITYMANSTFSTITGNNNRQSTIFFSTQASYISSYNTLLLSTIAVNNFAISTLSTAIFTNTTQLASNSTLFGQQLSTQNIQFGSTISSYNVFLVNTANAAANTVITSTVNSVNVATSNVTVSTIAAYNLFLSSLTNQSAEIGVSTLYTVDTLTLQGSTYTQSLDLATYRNFYVRVSSIISGSSNYRLTYNRNGINNLNYRRGVISIDINTVGQSYSNYGGQLRFDVNILGVPTTVWKNVYPFISNADYLAQYEYTIMNNVIWTNLLGLYPRVRVLNCAAVAASPMIQVNNVYDPSTILRGSPIVVSWSNYSFFPYDNVGQVPFEPQIVLETYVSSILYGEYFYPFSVSSATITAPYVVGSGFSGGPLQTATVNMYIQGYQSQPTTTTFRVLQPTFDNITIKNANYGFPSGSNSFIGGFELVAQTDARNYPLYNLPITINGTNPAFQSFNNSTIYSAANLTSNLINRAGFAGSPRNNPRLTYANSNFAVPNNFTEFSGQRGYPDFLFNMTNYRDLLAITSLGGSVTFTLNDGSVSTSFLATNFNTIVSTFVSTSFTSSYTLYEAFNPSLSRTSNTFNNRGANVSVLYNLSTPRFVSTARGVTVNPFVGPIGLSNATFVADTTITANIPNIGLTSLADPVSTLLFYNVINTPIAATSTTGMVITATVNTNNTNYSYIVSTTGSSAVQILNL